MAIGAALSAPLYVAAGAVADVVVPLRDSQASATRPAVNREFRAEV
jgi:hypothetical protein